jgi:uncharacterized membrane protein required for colicin V production
MVISIIFLLILAASVGILYTEGIWNNSLRLVNVVTAALLATNFWEPVANLLNDWQPSLTYFWDFVSLWLLFAIASFVLRLLTDLASRVKVRLLKLADRIAGPIIALLVGWVLVCFTAMTLHTAPLAREPFFGSFRPESPVFLGLLSPDRYWLAFVQKMSLGQFSREGAEKELKDEKYIFDPQGEFLLKYAARRAQLEAQMAGTHSLRYAPKGAK